MKKQDKRCVRLHKNVVSSFSFVRKTKLNRVNCDTRNITFDL